MVNKANKIIIIFCLFLMVYIVINMVNLISALAEDAPIESEILTDVEYNEVNCEFIELNKNQITVMVEAQEEKFEIYSPYKFIGITKGTNIVLLVPEGDSKKVAIKIEDESILN